MAYDVVIVGGGVMGSSTAYHLKSSEPSLRVLVIERDQTYARASTVLSAGNVRVQFNLEENIRISQHALDVLGSFATDMATASYTPDVGAKHQGNLFTVDADGEKPARAGLARQLEMGCQVEWVEAASIAERFAVFSNVGIVGGTLGEDDGSVDPSAMLRGYRSKATELGVEYLEATVDQINASGDRASGLTLGSGDVVVAPLTIVTAGAWTAGLLEDIGVDIPVIPKMRTVYVVTTPFEAGEVPSIFLPNGRYVIPESGNVWLVGLSSDDDPTGFDFRPAGRDRFEDFLWPGIVEYLPQFDSLNIERSWAGLYAVNTLDNNAIIGRWPGLSGLLIATGFSGHGLQQAPAVGRYLAELCLEQPHALDLRRLGPERVIRRDPLFEHAGRVI